MKSSQPIALIGGYDPIAKSFFSRTMMLNNGSIFINVNDKIIKRNNVLNLKIFQLKKILETLKNKKINNLLFIGKINRPNISTFESDGIIDKYIPALINSYKKGDGHVLSTVLKIFMKEGFKILSPRDISNSFFLNKNEIDRKILHQDKKDILKSIKILNDLSKYDNAQSLVIINGYILAIEAAEGTDKLLMRTASIRKKLNQIMLKEGLLIKIPKKNQSKVVDLPVVGLKTLRLVHKANLKGIVINLEFTIIHEKEKFLNYVNEYKLKIYTI